MKTRLRSACYSVSSFVLLSTALLSPLMMQGCAVFRPDNTLPQALEKNVHMVGYKSIRTWGDQPSKELSQSAIESLQQEKAYFHGRLSTQINALALSGGGGDGAFGAGLIYGWSQTKSFPSFKIVTGISTGALIAPLAFLSPKYNDRLKHAYTTMSDKDIFVANNMFSILLSMVNLKQVPSLADSKPLAKSIEQMVDMQMLRDIAAEHKKGRRLLVGTYQLNAQRLVIWNMGEIATSRNPGALQLFRKVLLASASIPATFPPQYFDVMANGKMYKEMHVDGGVGAQTILFENALYPFSGLRDMIKGQERKRTLYIIRNDKIMPQWENVSPQLKYIAIRSISSLIRSEGIGDFYRLYAYSQRYNIDYNLAFIPPTFHVEAKSEFDNLYMRTLFHLGEQLGRRGYQWSKLPPGFEQRD